MRQPSTTAVKYWFDYLPSSGKLIWKVGSRGHKKGEEAGTLTEKGYIKIYFEGHKYLAHRLVWLWHGRKLNPALCLDHINRDKTDNRIENLQEVTMRENNCNKGNPENYIRFRANQPRRPWVARYRRKWIGSFYTKDEALQALDCFITNNFPDDVRQSS